MILSSEDRKNVVGSIVSLKFYCLMIGRLSIMVGSLTGQLEGTVVKFSNCRKSGPDIFLRLFHFVETIFPTFKSPEI